VPAKRTPGSPGGKHRKPPEGNARRKAASTPKNTVSERDQRFPAVAPSQIDFGNSDTQKMQVLV